MQDTFDDTGRRVRKARVKANDKIAAHAQWVTNNPYRMPQAGQPIEVDEDDDGAATADDDIAGESGARRSGGPGEGSAAPSGSGAVVEDDEETRAFSDGANSSALGPLSIVAAGCICWVSEVCLFVSRHQYRTDSTAT